MGCRAAKPWLPSEADVVDERVDTSQIVPAMLSVLVLNAHELQAVQMEGTKRLPHLH